MTTDDGITLEEFLAMTPEDFEYAYFRTGKVAHAYIRGAKLTACGLDASDASIAVGRQKRYCKVCESVDDAWLRRWEVV